jgi:hypothetical protein
MLQQSKLELPVINKASSHRNSPLPLSPRIAKNKDVEFPDIFEKVPKDPQVINAKLIRGMKKHSSDKDIRSISNSKRGVERTNTCLNSKEELEKQGIFIYNN